MINPEILCRKHLLGEHGEIHKHRHNFVKHHSITNRIKLDQIEPSSMGARHDKLVAEMLCRGYNHQSPYTQPDISYLPKQEQWHIVNQLNSLSVLLSRCKECEANYLKTGAK